MEPEDNLDFLTKVAAISRGPNGDLLRRLVDILYQQQQDYDQEYDDEPLLAEETIMVTERSGGHPKG